MADQERPPGGRGLCRLGLAVPCTELSGREFGSLRSTGPLLRRREGPPTGCHRRCRPVFHRCLYRWGWASTRRHFPCHPLPRLCPQKSRSAGARAGPGSRGGALAVGMRVRDLGRGPVGTAYRSGTFRTCNTEHIRPFSGVSQLFVQCTKMLFAGGGGGVCVCFLKSVRKGLENEPGARV